MNHNTHALLIQSIGQTRRQAGLTVRDFCTVTGIHEQTYYRWNRDDGKHPNEWVSRLLLIMETVSGKEQFNKRLTDGIRIKGALEGLFILHEAYQLIGRRKRG